MQSILHGTARLHMPPNFLFRSGLTTLTLKVLKNPQQTTNPGPSRLSCATLGPGRLSCVELHTELVDADPAPWKLLGKNLTLYTFTDPKSS